jgi:hypothetical protein
MIYSPDHNFLMLKNVKVGGTSLEVELSKVLPDNSIVTEITPANAGHNPRNHNGFYNHMSYKDISSKIDLSKSTSYIFVRHPYDTQLSMLFYKLKQKNIIWKNISDIEKEKIVNQFFFEKQEDFSMLKSTKSIYSDKDKVLVDKVLKYELGIEDQINKILTMNNIKNISMNTFEKQYRPKEFTVKNTFNKDHLNKIYKEWAWEFNMFGYDR